jgi:hypothetical protein
LSIGRHGTKRVAKAVLVGTVPAFMLKTPNNRRAADRHVRPEPRQLEIGRSS